MLYVFIAVLSTLLTKSFSIGGLFDEVSRFLVHFYFLFAVSVLTENGASSVGLCGTNSESVLCVHGHKYNVSAEKKKPLKNKKK